MSRGRTMEARRDCASAGTSKPLSGQRTSAEFRKVVLPDPERPKNTSARPPPPVRTLFNNLSTCSAAVSTRSTNSVASSPASAALCDSNSHRFGRSSRGNKFNPICTAAPALSTMPRNPLATGSKLKCYRITTCATSERFRVSSRRRPRMSASTAFLAQQESLPLGEPSRWRYAAAKLSLAGCWTVVFVSARDRPFGLHRRSLR
jgi:hypothetical protein